MMKSAPTAVHRAICTPNPELNIIPAIVSQLRSTPGDFCEGVFKRVHYSRCSPRLKRRYCAFSLPEQPLLLSTYLSSTSVWSIFIFTTSSPQFAHIWAHLPLVLRSRSSGPFKTTD